MLAAHLGQHDRAVSLFARCLAAGATLGHAGAGTGLGTVGEWPFDLPLRSDLRFQALWRPDPSDGP